MNRPRYSVTFGRLLRKSRLAYCSSCRSVKVVDHFETLRLNSDKVPVGLCSTCYDLRNLMTVPDRNSGKSIL